MATDPQVLAVAAAATARHDANDRRVGLVEADSKEQREVVRALAAKVDDHAAKLARIEGASSGLARVVPWLAILLSAGGLVVGWLK